MNKAIGHFKTVYRHRKIVRKLCFKIGLYKQGLVHDLSKYSPAEFSVGAKYFCGYRSPNDFERKEYGYSAAWLHHKGRNKHHIEYWTDYPGRYEEIPNLPYHNKYVKAVEMPVKYVAEMFCDRVAACKVYKGKDYIDSDPWDYQERVREHLIIHPKTDELLTSMLLKLKEEGEDAACAYIREILENSKVSAK